MLKLFCDYMKKVGLVLEGGAMRGMYTAGVLDVFLDNNIKIDGIIGVSAGAIVGINYFSKQRGRTIRYNKKYVKDKRYISFSSLIKTGNITGHKIEGIGDDFIPSIVDLDLIKDVILVNDLDAINMSKKLSKELGIGVGISSGANMIGSILLKEMGYRNVITVFPDDNKKYLSTDLGKGVDNSKKLLSNGIKCIGYEVL